MKYLLTENMMIKSMTGYGRAQKRILGRDITAEIKSVNHRYFDFSCRVPRAFSYLEEYLREAASKAISRGKVDVFFYITGSEDTPVLVKVNRPLLSGYMSAFDTVLEQHPGVANDVSLMGLSHIGDMFSAEKQPDDENEIKRMAGEVFNEALLAFVSMREAEGKRLYQDLTHRGRLISELVNEIEKRAPDIVDDYQTRLRQRIEEMIGGVLLDEGRLLTEIALFAERVSINEELVRLKSHLEQYFSILEDCGPVGRKMDFLLQEMNREINTIGSKCNDLAATRIVVEIKSELEKIREQIQNVE